MKITVKRKYRLQTGKNILANHIFEKGLASVMHKELKTQQ